MIIIISIIIIVAILIRSHFYYLFASFEDAALPKKESTLK